jgi:uncharacterized protein
MRLLYLHGFRSSPRSAKAKIMAQRVAAAQAQGQVIDWHCPQLPHSPADAFDQIWQWVAPQDKDSRLQPLAVVGSSLGGFYAATLVEKLLRAGIYARCVLLNPAAHPGRDLSAHIGHVDNWHGEGGFEFTEEHVTQLNALETRSFTRAERYMAIIAKGDEVLSWMEMTARYPAREMMLLPASDHAISEFELYAPQVLNFCLHGHV